VVEAEDGSEDPIRIAAGGTLQFRTEPGNGLKWWSILWRSDTPFVDGTGWLSGHHGQPQGKTIGASANGGGQNQKRYTYAVVASDGADVHFRDPDVVVGPDA
jgi:hypothetical protein